MQSCMVSIAMEAFNTAQAGPLIFPHSLHPSSPYRLRLRSLLNCKDQTDFLIAHIDSPSLSSRLPDCGVSFHFLFSAILFFVHNA